MLKNIKLRDNSFCHYIKVSSSVYKFQINIGYFKWIVTKTSNYIDFLQLNFGKKLSILSKIYEKFDY